MKKTEIRVTIDSLEKQQKAIEILERYGEKIWNPILGKKWAMEFNLSCKNLVISSNKNKWLVSDIRYLNRTEITIDELEKLLKKDK